jgi:hypothetical protein
MSHLVTSGSLITAVTLRLKKVRVKIGDVYWIIGLMKIENMGKWSETNEPMDVPQISLSWNM